MSAAKAQGSAAHAAPSQDPDVESPRRRDDESSSVQTPDAVPPLNVGRRGPRVDGVRRSPSPSPASSPRRQASVRSGSASASRSRGAVNLDNFESSWKAAQLINSPRSLVVCQKFGIQPSELLHKPYEQFALGGAAISEAIARRRYEHHEAKRQQKLALLRSERGELIEAERQRAERGESSPRSVGRPHTPTASTMSSPARESARRLRESQSARLAELEKERKEKAAALQDALEVRTALAVAQKLVHEQEVRAHGAREHLKHVEETSANAKRLLKKHNAAQRDAQTRHDLERAIRSLDAQARQLRIAQERGTKHEESVLDARQRATQHQQQQRAKHERHVLAQDAYAAEAESRVAAKMAQRAELNAQHGSRVVEGNQRASAIAAESKMRASQHVDEKDASTEARLVQREHESSARRDRSASARRKREAEAKDVAAMNAAQRRAYFLSKNESMTQSFDDRRVRTEEERIWDSELKREAALDRAEEVGRVRRAKEHERKQQLLNKHAAHGCLHGDLEGSASFAPSL